MAFIIPSYVAGAIRNYSDLIEELRDMLDDETYEQSKLDRAIRKAEAMFNRELRTPQMETRVEITAASEIVTLPEDFLSMRGLFISGQPERQFVSMSPASVTGGYSGIAGTPGAYAIEGETLRVAPVGTAALVMNYYARIPALSEAIATNWLLEDHPDVYVSGAMYYLARRERDAEGMAQASSEVSEMLASINSVGMRNRWGAGPLVPSGMQQVRGVRA
ncbi:phage adaptor protein [Sphingomonas japonica]|uniref:Phage gp6-like head-tail connector protein n=1 Tax=Sphingomonas japonica TaxID=511662 RepID=A0ABX0U583_9SPHN|nr:hypothetical protein [Sphingomonas japonica]NIJ24831.1 hypothetical protein [Sphingomonas japonica]